MADKMLQLKDQRVLIADAQPHSRRFIYDLCRSFGLVTIAATQSIDEAMLKLEQSPWEILLCAWSSAIDARQFTRRIRADSSKPYQRIRIIVLRLEATAADVYAARDSGADEFLAMPLSQGSLLGALQRASSNPQHFIDCDIYKGPCRRRRQREWENERRRVEGSQCAQKGPDS